MTTQIGNHALSIVLIGYVPYYHISEQNYGYLSRNNGAGLHAGGIRVNEVRGIDPKNVTRHRTCEHFKYMVTESDKHTLDVLILRWLHIYRYKYISSDLLIKFDSAVCLFEVECAEPHDSPAGLKHFVTAQLAIAACRSERLDGCKLHRNAGSLDCSN